MKVTKEANTFYALMALLKVAKNNIEYLCGRAEVAYNLKHTLRTLNNRITDLEKACNRSLDGSDLAIWQREWTERDFEVYGSILCNLNDMSEEQRAVAEQFMEELKKGNVKAEAA